MMIILMIKPNQKLRVTILNLFFCCYLFQLPGYAQQVAPNLIKADSSWNEELFFFPLSFAPELGYKGFEEALFPKAWANKESTFFWSYVFAWRIETQRQLTGTDLEQNLKNYFDGLMSARSGLPKDSIPRTVSFGLKKVSQRNRSQYIGKIQIFDAFTLQAPLILNVSVDQFFCEKHSTSIILFRFSPKAPEHPVWEKLNEFTISNEMLYNDKCNYN